MLFFHYVTRKLVRRLGNNALTVIVIGCVLAGAILGTEFLLGLRAASQDSIPADHVMVLDKGAINEGLSGGIEPETVNAVQVLPGIRETNGKRAVSQEIIGRVLLAPAVTHSGIAEPQVVRGVDPIGFELHGVKIVDGRMPAAGAPELIIGTQLRKKNPKIGIGSKIKLPSEEWTVVGVFSAGGSVYEGEAWSDRARMATVFKITKISSIIVATTSPAAAAELINTLNNSKSIEATASLEREARGSAANLKQVTKVIFILVLALCLIGVFVTATNLHASLISRLPELVTFVALGVPRARVARMMVFESLLLAGVGVVIALGLALLFNGKSSTMFSAGALFELRLGLVPVLFVLAFATLVGLLGGIAPSLMVRRIDLVKGLR